MINIKCPNKDCNVEYKVYKIETNVIQCQDCGTFYHQGFSSMNMPEWIKSMSVKLSKTLDFWKGL